jgi:hypothetical protein
MMEIGLNAEGVDASFMKFYYIKQNGAGSALSPTATSVALSQGKKSIFHLSKHAVRSLTKRKEIVIALNIL